MFDDMVNLFDLGAFSDEEKELFRTDFTYKKQMSQLLKEARQAAKRDTQSLRIAIRFLPTPLYKLWQTENLHAALHLINTSSNTNERTWLA